MTMLLHERPGLLAEGRLEIGRDDIIFFNATPERVCIEIIVWNRGAGPSAPTTATVQAAPLGAFVPWRPLLSLPVPAIAPGGAVVLQAEALRATTRPLGPPDRVPPRRLLTALAAGDEEPATTRAPRRAVSARLPHDLFDLLSRGNPHFAGNLNVFVGGRAVERHLAQALRVYPGRVNYAMFVVGSGPDTYAFHLTGDAAAWEARLYDGTAEESLAIDPHSSTPLAPSQWITVNGPRMMFLVLQPPESCLKGSVDVHVVQGSTGREAVVEFDLDPQAAGPGCFVV